MSRGRSPVSGARSLAKRLPRRTALLSLWVASPQRACPHTAVWRPARSLVPLVPAVRRARALVRISIERFGLGGLFRGFGSSIGVSAWLGLGSGWPAGPRAPMGRRAWPPQLRRAVSSPGRVSRLDPDRCSWWWCSRMSLLAGSGVRLHLYYDRSIGGCHIDCSIRWRAESEGAPFVGRRVSQRGHGWRGRAVRARPRRVGPDGGIATYFDLEARQVVAALAYYAAHGERMRACGQVVHSEPQASSDASAGARQRMVLREP